jgi:hypothetical protein
MRLATFRKLAMLKTTQAMAARVADRFWEIEDLLPLLD